MQRYNSDVFEYHEPDLEARHKHQLLREAAMAFAQTIDHTCPSCADRSTAFRCVREALLWANASVALRGKV